MLINSIRGSIQQSRLNLHNTIFSFNSVSHDLQRIEDFVSSKDISSTPQQNDQTAPFWVSNLFLAETHYAKIKTTFFIFYKLLLKSFGRVSIDDPIIQGVQKTLKNVFSKLWFSDWQVWLTIQLRLRFPKVTISIFLNFTGNTTICS